MTSKDDYFPRGGIKRSADADSSVKKPKNPENLFGCYQTVKKSKGKKRRKIQQNTEEVTTVADFVNKSEGLTAVSADTLSIKKIHEGMVVLACIKRHNVLTINVDLPGRCNGELLVKNISPSYTKLVADAVTKTGSDIPSLNKILPVGAFLPVRVQNFDTNNDKLKIYVTCNPADINQQFKHADFTKNMLVWGAIKEKSDHGYLIDLGVKNCRAHLPFDAIDNDGQEYCVGKVLYMTITKSVSDKEATTLTLSAQRVLFEKIVESMGTSLEKVIPGMQVEFLVQKALKDGLQGQYFDECTGFINDLYLQKPFDSPKKYKEFTSIKARLLYVHPASKLGYFTLKSLTEKPTAKTLSVGDWVPATIVGKAGSGIVVKLTGGLKGFITHKRLLQTIKSKEKSNEDLATLIANKYPVGVTKHCTVLAYDYMERLYICTFEQITDVMNPDQLKVAQVVKGIITGINDHGLVIKVGKLQTFAPKDNLANVQYSENIKKQFKVGQEVTAKIWRLDSENEAIILTLKPDLLSSNLHLTSSENYSHSEKYPGVVISIQKTGVLLLFYAGVKGWLPARNIPQLGNKDARNEFYKGQIIRARVEHAENEKLTLTLNLPAKKRVPVGKIITKPKISQVTDDGLFVFIGDTEAFVPRQQLAVGALGKLLSETYKVGEVLDEELMCVINSNLPVLSVREHNVYKREDLKIPGINEIVVNVIMRGIYKDNALHVPLKSHPGEFKVNHKELRNLERYESICAKVETRKSKGAIGWTVQLGNVFNYSYLETLQYLDQYLGGIQRLRKRYIHNKNPLGDLEIGATVDCVINKIDAKRGCSVFVLPMNCQGLVSLDHCPKNLKPGAQVKGKILWVNYELKYAAITLEPSIMQKMADKQDQSIDMQVFHQQKGRVVLELLHANKDVAVGVLRQKYNKQLVFLPVKIHENDFTPKVNMYDHLLGQEIKVRLHKMKSGRLLAVTDLMFVKFMEKRKKLGEMIVLRNNLLKQRKEDVAKSKVKEKKKSEKVFVEVKEEDEGIASCEDIKSEVESVSSVDQEGGDDGSSEDSEEEKIEVEVTNNKRKLDEEPPTKTKKKKKDKPTTTIKDIQATNRKAEVILPGMSAFFEEEPSLQPKTESDDDEDATPQPKKKLTPAERLQKAKDEEARLRKIETELADASLLPQNAEQFDRALLGNPDDSELWTRYIAFHAQSTEFEKARAVARRALERISYTALQDRLNVWLAFLNLENMYGTKDSFQSLFEEAARCNDTLTIYLETIKMLADMSKFTEMEEKVKKARGKFKQELQMWLEIGKVYYKCGKFAEARRMKDSALLTLTDKKAHMQLIVQFAIMEFVHGESNQGEALFETILQADPKRVDIWCTYVDQLVKKEKIDVARNVLSRAVGQKLPYKKMRTLFKKYHAFETTYGDEETLSHVTNLLREYSDQ